MADDMTTERHSLVTRERASVGHEIDTVEWETDRARLALDIDTGERDAGFVVTLHEINKATGRARHITTTLPVDAAETLASIFAVWSYR